MKKVLAMVLTVAMLLTCLVAMPVSATTETMTNLMPNGDFEAATEGVVDSWTLGKTGQGTPAYALATYETDSVAENSYVAVVQEKTTGEDGSEALTGLSGVAGQAFKIADNAHYVLKFKYKSITDKSAYVKISITSDGWAAAVDETFPVSDADAATLEEADWATGTKVFSLKDYAGIEEASMDFAFRAHPNYAGAVWFDDIELYKIESGNFIVNGNFEYDAEGATEIVGWEQTNPGSALAVVTAAKGADGSKGVGSGEGYSGLRTTVNFTDDMRKLDEFTLSFYFGYNGGGAMPTVTVTANKTDSTTASYTYAAYNEEAGRGLDSASYAAGLGWDYALGNHTIDLDNLLTLAGGVQNIASMTIQVIGSNCGGWWDNITLTGVRGLPDLNTDGDLITNGSFEYANEGTTIGQKVAVDAVGWTQTNDAAKYEWRVVEKPYLIPADDGGAYIVYATNGAGLKQTIELDEDADYVTNQEKYRWKLGFSSYVAGSVPLVKINVTAYSADGESKVTSFSGGADFTATSVWTMNSWVLDISNAIDCFGAPITKFDIELKVTGKEGGFEAVSLIPEYDETKVYPVLPVNIPLANPSFELDETGTSIANGGTITGWTSGSATAGWSVSELAAGSGGGFYTPSHGTKGLVAAPGCADLDYISQTIEIPSDADYYANMGDYTWKLSLSTYYILKCEVIVYNADKTASASTEFSSYDARKWDTFDCEWDITDALRKVGKAKYVEFRFRSNSASQPTFIDNVKFTATKNDVVDITIGSVVKNGTFESFDESGVATDWQLGYADATEVNDVFNYADMSLNGYGAVKVASGTVGEQAAVGSVYQTISVEEGKYYLIDFSYKAAEETAMIEIVDPADGTKMHSRVYDNTTGADPKDYGDWTKVSWIKRAELFKATKTGNVNFVLTCVEGRSGAYFDDVTVKEYEVDESNLTKRRNLLVNGSFEEEATGAVGFIGWTVTGAPVSTTIEDARARDGEKVMYHYGDTVSQTVEITDYNEAAGENYGYKLDFSYGSYGGGGQNVKIDMVFADGDDEDENDDTVTHTFNPQRVHMVDADGKAYMKKTDDAGAEVKDENGNVVYEEIEIDRTLYFPHVVLASTPENVSLDLSFLTKANTARLKSITITLPAVGTACYLDDFCLYTTDMNVVDIIDKDDNLLTEIPAEEGMTILADAFYCGEAEDAKLILAVYNVIDEDTLELASMDLVALGEDGTFENAMLGGQTLTEGENIIKAFVIEKGSLKPVAYSEVK